MRVKRIHFVSRNITVHDAVGNFSIDFSNFFEDQGIAVHLYAQDFSAHYGEKIHHVSLIQDFISEEDILICSYSIYDEYFCTYINLPCKKSILYFHNVTPDTFFSPFSESFAQILSSAHLQYPLFSAFDAVVANSIFSLEQIRPFLRKNAVLSIFPPYFSLNSSSITDILPVQTPDSRYHLLWVGRITPHKRPDLALKIFNELIKSGVDASLTFVGGGRYDFPSFAEYIDACLAALPAYAQTRVQFVQDISDEQLAWLYRHSDLLLCTSAHEGYCMPLAEAAACNLPVAATPQPAVLETLNGGGIILDENPIVAAQEIKNFLTTANEKERRAAIPVLKPLPTDELIQIIMGDA